MIDMSGITGPYQFAERVLATVGAPVTHLKGKTRTWQV